MSGTTVERSLLLLRAAVFTVVSTGLALCAHLLAHGIAPSLVALGVAALGGAEVGMLLAARRRGLPALLIGLGTAQLGVHLAFVLFPAPTPGHSPHGGPSPAMLLAHALATVGCAWWLCCGESQLFRLVDLAASVLPAGWRLAGVTVGVPSVSSARKPAATRAWSPLLWVLAHSLVRRGPPPGLASAC